MAVGDVFVLKMKQNMFGQDILNVFYYRQIIEAVTGKPNSQQLFESFDGGLLTVWEPAFINSITIDEMEVININAPVDTYSATPLNNVGLRAIGDNLRAPTWMAAGFKSNRAGAGTRSSFKRFAGIAEEDINDNVISPAFVTLSAGLRAAMGEVRPSIEGSSFEPVQVKSGWLLGFPPVVNFIITTFLDAKLTSQVSRKP